MILTKYRQAKRLFPSKSQDEIFAQEVSQILAEAQRLWNKEPGTRTQESYKVC